MLGIGVKDSTKFQVHTLVRREFATATTVEQNSIDDDRNHRQEVLGGEETIRRPEEAEQDTKGFGGISKIQPVGIYPDPVGVTEWNKLVAPRCRIASDYCNSV